MSKISFRQLFNKLDLRFFKRTPLVHQTEASECGLACIAMICGHYGKHIDLLELRHRFNLSSRGSTLSNIIEITRQLDLTSRAFTLELEDLQALTTPCLLHWEFNHFVVLVSIGDRNVVIHDPARGRRKISFAELSTSFTGVALEVFPTSSFIKKVKSSSFSLSRLTSGVYGFKKALGKIFCLSIIIETISLVMPIGTQLVMDHAIPANDSGLLSLICSGLLIFILLRAVISMLRAWSSLVMETLISIQWQSGLFSHLLKLPLSFFEKRSLGDIQSRFSSLETLRETFTSSIVGAIMDAIMVLGVLIMMTLYGGWLTWIVISFTAIYIYLRVFTYTYYRQLSEESLVRKARASSFFMETLYGIATIKMQRLASKRSSRWLDLEVDAINTGIQLRKMELLFEGINALIAACDQIVILWLGTKLVMDNNMTLGMFVAFGAFRSQFTERVSSLTGHILQLFMMKLHNERIADIAVSSKEETKPETFSSTEMKPLSLSTYELSYSYDDQSPPVIYNLNISVKPGESIAIVGPSGVGKSTLMKVLCGLFTPMSGRIEVDNIDITRLGVNNYQKMIACVMQDDKLFSGSIRDNICGFENIIDEDWMQSCAQASSIHDIIMQMPMGYETILGELGEGLSGGQKQRLFIARAIYKKPSILFLDEATSALDKESEAAVNMAIKNLNITRIIIAHRESTIASVDRLINLGETIN